MCRLLTKQNINEIAKCTIKKSGGSVFVSSHPIRSHSHDSTSIAMLAPVNLFIPTAIKHRSGNRFPKMEGRFNLQWPLCLPCLDTHCAALKIASLISTPQLDQFTMEEVIHSASSTNQIKDPHACNIPEKEFRALANWYHQNPTHQEAYSKVRTSPFASVPLGCLTPYPWGNKFIRPCFRVMVNLNTVFGLRVRCLHRSIRGA